MWKRQTLTSLWLVFETYVVMISCFPLQQWKRRDEKNKKERWVTRLSHPGWTIAFSFSCSFRVQGENFIVIQTDRLCVRSKGNDRQEDEATKWACIKIIGYRQRHVREDEHLTWQNLIKIFSRLDYEQSADNEKRERKKVHRRFIDWISNMIDRTNECISCLFS